MTQTIRYRSPQESRPVSADPLVILGVCVVLGALVLSLFGPTAFYADPEGLRSSSNLGFEFINCDDEPYVYGNRDVQQGITFDTARWCLTTGHAANWHPLTWASHVLDCQLYGPLLDEQRHVPTGGWFTDVPWPGGHHFTSVVLHAAAAIVLFLALRLMTGTLWRSAIVAAMFAVHPLRVESVAWIAERKDVLSGLFWMLTMLAYGYYALRPSIRRYIAVVVCFALGLMSKSMLVTLPCVLLLLDFWPLRRWRIPSLAGPDNSPAPSNTAEEPWIPTWLFDQSTLEQSSFFAKFLRFIQRPNSRLVIEKLPLFAMSAGVCCIVMHFQHQSGAMDMSIKFPMPYHLANAACATVDYMWKTIWPANLAIFYPNPAILSLHDSAGLHTLVLHGLGALAILVAITGIAIWGLRRHGYLAVGWLWYLGTLVPVLGIIQVGVQGMADRYTYLPMIGFYIMAVWGIAELVAKSKGLRLAAAMATVVLLATWSYLTTEQVATWKNSYTVFQHAVEVVPNCFFGYNHLGLAYHTEAAALKNVNPKLAAAYAEEAGKDFKKSVEITPYYDSSNGNLGVYYINKKMFPEAIASFERAAKLNPYLSSHHGNLAAAYLNAGRFDDAIDRYRKAIERQPEAPTYHFLLALVLLHEGRIANATQEMREGLKYNPNDGEVLLQLAWILATTDVAAVRNGREAEAIVTHIMRVTGQQNAGLLRILAAAYAEQGRFPEAVQAAQQALALAQQQKNEPLVKQLSEMLTQYKAQKAIRVRTY
jgi:tetratricopeptide (TPR) repeat protein